MGAMLSTSSATSSPTFGGSHFSIITGSSPEAIPAPSLVAPAIYHALHEAIQAGLVKSAHELSEGGLAVAAAEMSIGGHLGIDMTFSPDPGQISRILFGETNGCLIAEVEPASAEDFEKRFSTLPLIKIGTVTTEQVLKLIGAEIPVSDLTNAFNAPIPVSYTHL